MNFDLGPYSVYIWPAYGVSAVLLIGVTVWTVAAWRRARDKPAATRAFLDEVGNPFSRISRDDDGRASIEWGVYGVPETFVVDGKGIIRLKFVGPLSDAVLKQQVLPAIKAAQANP